METADDDGLNRAVEQPRPSPNAEYRQRYSSEETQRTQEDNTVSSRRPVFSECERVRATRCAGDDVLDYAHCALHRLVRRARSAHRPRCSTRMWRRVRRLIGRPRGAGITAHRCTSVRSARYSALVDAGAGPGRNCALSKMAHGVMLENCGYSVPFPENTGSLTGAFGVGRQ